MRRGGSRGAEHHHPGWFRKGVWAWARARYRPGDSRGAQASRWTEDQASARHDCYGGTGYLRARLGRREDRGRYTGDTHRSRGPHRRAETVRRLRFGVLIATAAGTLLLTY